MKLLFAHDTVVEFDGVNFYSHLLHEGAWKPYLEVFETIQLCVRSTTAKSGSLLDAARICNGPRIEVTPVPGINSVRERIFNRAATRCSLTSAMSKADCVMVRLPSEIGLLAAKIARENEIPYICEVVGNGFQSLWHHGRRLAKANAPYVHWRMKQAVKHAPFASYVTNRYLQNVYPTNGESLACSDVYIEEIPSYEPRRVDPEKQATIGMVAPLITKYKGIDTAFKALVEVRKKFPNVMLRILGEGDPQPWERAAAELRVRDIVRFDGTLPAGRQVMEWFDQLDVYIQPSLTEGLPRAVIEAMSRGLPVIASDAGAMNELLPASSLHKKRDHAALSSKLIELLMHEKEREACRRHNIQAATRFQWDLLLAKRVEFWRRFADYVEAKGR